MKAKLNTVNVYEKAKFDKDLSAKKESVTLAIILTQYTTWRWIQTYNTNISQERISWPK